MKRDKKDKGITLIALIITIIILIILTSIGIGSATGLKGSITNSKETVAMSNIKKIQQAVLEAYIKYKETGNADTIIGTKMTYEEAKEVEAEFQEIEPAISLKMSDYGALATDIAQYYYKLNKTQLKLLSIINITEDEEFMVNYSTGEVFDLTTQQTGLGTVLYVST